MNLIPVTVQNRRARASGFDFDLPPGDWFVERCVLGVRPEDLSENLREGEPQVDLRVDVVEVLGADQYLYGKIGEDEVTARVDPHFTVVTGDKVPLAINPARIHVFDTVTELALI